MNKFKFIKYKDPDNDFDLSQVIFTTKATTLPEILHEFECFLKACSFNFVGQLKIVDEDVQSE